MDKDLNSHALQPGIILRSNERTYKIIKVLGSGSFGITYLATSKVSIGNITTTIRFAIKEHFMSSSSYRDHDGLTVLTVPTAKTDVESSRKDFITEAERLKMMCRKSRSIVSVNETFEANGTAYYVMEYLDGGRPSKCSEKEAVSIVLQVADALREIHSERVLHLDLKPDNIVMKKSETGEIYPVLIDFGISKHFDVKGRPTSRINAKGATPGYAPQEQYAGVDEFSPKYDIYPLGAVLYFLTTGMNPPDTFKISPSQKELKQELSGKVSPNIEMTILNAMKTNASERTSTIQEFCDNLMGIDFEPELELESSKLKFAREKGQKNVTVKTNIGWTVQSDASWCKAERKNNKLVISVAKNKYETGRQCEVEVKGLSFSISRKLRISQEGIGTVILRSDATWWSRNSRKFYTACGCLLIIGALVWLCVSLSSNSNRESMKLTEAIQSGNVMALKKFADQDSVRAFPELIYQLTQQKNLIEAKKYAERYSSLDAIGSLVSMAEVTMQEGKYEEAKQYLEKYLRFDPGNTTVVSLLKMIDILIKRQEEDLTTNQDSAN